MVKAVQAEESISSYFDGLLQNRVNVEVGLLVGKAGVGSRDLVLALIPTPSQDGEQAFRVTVGAASAAKVKKSGTQKAKCNEPNVSIDLEADWIAEHALQVSRMLPGGISVLGLYLFAPDSGYGSCSSQLCSTLASIAADSNTATLNMNTSMTAAAIAVTGRNDAAATASPAEHLLLHVDSATRKFTMRSCQVSSAATASSTLKPCELKYGSSIPSLVCLRCTHTFDLPLPVATSQSSDSELSMQQVLQQAVAAETARVQSAVAAVAGRVPSSTSNETVSDALSSSSSSSSNYTDAVPVDMYCLPHAAAALQPSSSSSSILGGSRLHGTVEALAYVHKRDSITKAISELKADVINSLSARLQLLADEALAAADEAEAAAVPEDESAAVSAAAVAAHPLLLSAAAGQSVKLGLSRRVLLPWCLSIQVCDYLAEGETADHAVQRAQQLLQLRDLQPSAVVQLESAAVEKPKLVTGSVVIDNNSSSSSSRGGSSMSCSGPLLAAAAAGLVAVLSIGIAVMNLT